MLAWVMNLDFAGGGEVAGPPAGQPMQLRSGQPNRPYGFASNYRYAWRLACLIF